LRHLNQTDKTCEKGIWEKGRMETSTTEINERGHRVNDEDMKEVIFPKILNLCAIIKHQTR
jgi:hypothetical protein